MGDSATTFPPPILKGIKQLNNSIWEFYSPSTTAPEVEIMFFHGLHRSDMFDSQEAFWKTWLSRSDRVLWPKDWLSECFPQARILSVSYDSSVKKREEAADGPDPFVISENLIHDMITDARVGQTCRVLLVGHSLGSIIIKDVVLECIRMRAELSTARCQKQIDEISTFLENCRGVFYYSPPNGGSRILDQATPIWRMNEPLMKLLRTLSTDTSRINYRFASVRINQKIKTQAITETKKTKFLGITAVFVEEGSARADVDNLYTVTEADHFEVCKPWNNTTCAIFRKLELWIKDVLQSEKPTLEIVKAWASGGINLSTAEQDMTILWLGNLLHERDNLRLNDAAWALSNLADKDQKDGTDIRVRFAKKKGAIDGLLKCLLEYSNPDLQEAASWTLTKLFNVGDNNDIIRSSIAKDDGAISVLVKLLSKHNADGLQEAASWNLCHLAEIDDSLKSIIANKEGAIAGLVECLVKPTKADTRDAAAYTLCSLISLHDPVKLRIVKEKGAIAGLVECSSAEDPDLQRSAAEALCSLAKMGDRLGDQSIRASIVKEGGARVFT